MMGQIRKTIETLDRTLTHAVHTLLFNRHSTKTLTHLIEISCFSVLCCHFTILLSLFRIVLSSFHHHHKQFKGLARWLTSHMKEFHVRINNLPSNLILRLLEISYKVVVAIVLLFL
ncbi:hypothetical protein AB3S75_024059 [Citrus x aurantiifolia]